MKVLRILMKPMKFFILLLMFAALIYFRSIIFHSNVNQHINTAISYIEERFDVSIPSHMTASDERRALVQNECESIGINIANKQPDIGRAPVAEVTKADETTAIMETLADAISSINNKVDMLFEADKADPANESVADGEALASVDRNADNLASSDTENATVSTTDSASVDAKQVLMMARQLFWGGKAHNSEKLYLDLINIDDNDPDIYGELGNVYYTQGKWKQAGEAYYEAAVRLLAQNRDERTGERVSYMLRVIQGLDVVSAEKLRNKISG